jgi:hypothetical protein
MGQYEIVTDDLDETSGVPYSPEVGLRLLRLIEGSGHASEARYHLMRVAA